MVKAGIIDPTKVVRLASEHAASIGSPTITTEAMVAHHIRKDVRGRGIGHAAERRYPGRTESHGLLGYLQQPGDAADGPVQPGLDGFVNSDPRNELAERPQCPSCHHPGPCAPSSAARRQA